jgi:uncharacterized protein YjdB
MTLRRQSLLVALAVLPGLLLPGCGGSSGATLSAIAVTTSPLRLAVGGVGQLVVTAINSDGTRFPITASLTFSSDASAVAAVSSSGVVTGLAEGSATITAAASGLTANVSVTISSLAPTLVAIDISPPSAQVAVRGTEQLTVSGLYSDSSTANFTAGSTFVSSSPGVATVSAGGLVTGVSAGSTTIVATHTASGRIATATVFVVVGSVAPTLVSIAVTPAGSTLAPGATQQLTVTGTYSDSSTANLTAGSTFVSSSPGVATVSAAGLVTAVGVGTTTITATHTASSKTATSSVSTPQQQPAQTLLDFESSSPYPFTDFDGAVTTKIANPHQTGINTSATVMQLVKGTGQVWAGSKIAMAAPIDFSTKRIFKVKVFSPVAGIKLLLKFEGAGSFFQKLSAPIAAANVWEELTFDFSAEAVNNLNSQIVFMFDFGTVGNGGPLSTYLFDDVTQLAGTGPILDLPVLPLTFESTSVVYPFADFGGAVTKVLPNPFPTGINKSATVVQFIKNPGEASAGSVIQMAGPIDFSSNKIVKVKVWAPVAGKKLMLKFEGSPTDFDGGAFETDALIGKANEWVELTFDFSSPTLFPPVNNNDSKIVFFFDFGTSGDGSANSTYYFDDVAFPTSP